MKTFDLRCEQISLPHAPVMENADLRSVTHKHWVTAHIIKKINLRPGETVQVIGYTGSRKVTLRRDKSIRVDAILPLNYVTRGQAHLGLKPSCF